MEIKPKNFVNFRFKLGSKSPVRFTTLRYFVFKVSLYEQYFTKKKMFN